jgi:hypothetical protein
MVSLPQGVHTMRRLSPHHWMAFGLLLISLGVGLRAIGPATLRGDLGDLFLGGLLGVGLGMEILALIKMRRSR